MELYFIGWITLALIVALIGKDKKIGFAGALLWSVLLSPLIGLLIVMASNSASSSQPDQYLRYVDAAKRAQFKGKYEKAIDHYQDALYHLKNDYKGPSKERGALINQIEGVISKLKMKNAFNPGTDVTVDGTA